jgi:hypothetical protein
VAYKSSGTLLITTKNINQVRMLLKTTIFNNIQLHASIAWTSQTSQEKIYAPEFLQDTIEAAPTQRSRWHPQAATRSS